MEGSVENTVSKVRILVVDDAPVAQKALKLILKALGHEVVIAKSGEEAIELFDSSFDAVLMDFHMPGMNGSEATRVIRDKERKFSKKKSTYILGLSANDVSEIEDVCIGSGMNKVLVKPIHSEMLEELLCELSFKELTPIQR